MDKLKRTFFQKFIFPVFFLLIFAFLILYVKHVFAVDMIIKNNESSGENDLKVLKEDCSRLFYDHLLEIAKIQFEKRREIISEAYKSAESVKNYQKTIKNKLLDITNSFPEKTPLNAKITNIIDCGDYRIENVVFESRPNLQVPGNLYIPAKGGVPFPAILEACGHSANGKAAEKYQKAAILLAKNGFVAFVIDTYAQGERGSVNHTQIDIGAMLVGTDLVAYQAWDNIRAIDYLCSRAEVDSTKIGVTGNSGGGTQTMYMMGFDPRVKVVAPSCGLHTRERMFTWAGLADGCHNFAYEGMKMLEFADYFILFAPKPALVLAGEKDNTFDIIAAAKTVREAKWFYKELGALDNIDIFTVDEGHGFYKGLREGATWWFKKYLMNKTEIVKEPELIIQPDEKLWATKTGQVLTGIKNSRSVIDINIQQAKDFENQRKLFWKNNPEKLCVEKVKELINYDERNENKDIKFDDLGEILYKGIKLKKLNLLSRDGFPLPALMYVPENLKKPLPVTIYLNDKGKNNAFETETALSTLIQNERIVFAVDIRGFGETTVDLGEMRKSLHAWNDQHQISQTSLYLGYPLIGQRVQDVTDILDHLDTYSIIKKSDIELIGIGHCGPVALHAAVIDERITGLKIINSIRSFMDIITEPNAKHQFKNVVPGAMKYYDLIDLVNSLSPKTVKIIDPVDAYGNIIKMNN